MGGNKSIGLVNGLFAWLSKKKRQIWLLEYGVITPSQHQMGIFSLPEVLAEFNTLTIVMSQRGVDVWKQNIPTYKQEEEPGSRLVNPDTLA